VMSSLPFLALHWPMRLHLPNLGRVENLPSVTELH
jgi:hypothetical protein